MFGIFFLLLIIIWLFVSIKISTFATNKIPNVWWRGAAGVLVFAFLLPLPLIDEIVGGWQFKKLCESNVVRVNKETARGKTIYAEPGGYETPVPGTWIKVWKMTTRYLDVVTGEVVVSFDHLRAEGGHLFPGFASGHEPLTFSGTCHPSNIPDKNFYKNLGLIRIEK